MSWIQPSEAEVKNSGYSLERATPSNPTFSFKSPQTVDPGSSLLISSSPSPAIATLAQACVSPLSLQPWLPFPSHLPSLFFPSTHSYAQARRGSTLAVALYTREHLTSLLPWPPSIPHRPAVSFLRREVGWTGPSLLPTPSSSSAPGTGPCGVEEGGS